MARPEKRCVTAEDLYRFQLISDCAISPDGRHMVFCVHGVERKTQKKHANLWIVPTDGGRARQFTCGKHVDSQPKWSPDGNQIAFLSTRSDEKQAQTYIISFHGGEACPLTNLKGTFDTFEWSPDGKQLVCQFRKRDRDAIEREEDEEKKKLGILSRHIRRVFYKLDDTGYLPKERWHLWIIDARGGRARQVTHGDVYDEWEPSWSPNGDQIVFCSNRSKDPDLDPDAIDLFVMPSSGGSMRKLDAPFGRKMLPRFSPDAQWIAYIGCEGRGQWWKNDCLWVVAATGQHPARNLTEQFDFDVSSSTLTDMSAPAMTPPTWSRDGGRIYFQVSRHGNTVLTSISRKGDNLESIVGDEGVVGTFSFDKAERTLAYFHANATDPGQIWVYGLSSKRARKLTHFSENLLRGIDLGEVEAAWFEGAAGNDVQGWILKPPGFDQSKQYPSILEIHGGPLLQYGNLFMHEFYYLAAHGYVVYFCNPRGSRGYGEAHAKAIWNAWGTADYEDLMAWVEFVAKKPYIDHERMGVTGGSYGGFMTNWIIGHTNRFKAAVTQRCVSNQISAWGSSDFNWIFEQTIGSDQPPWENFEQYWSQSPLKYMGRATTPTLVIHSEQDLRCPLEQGEQVYVALKKQGVDTELVLFPDEPHGLSRTGRTDRRIERLNHILRWFDRYLKQREK